MEENPGPTIFDIIDPTTNVSADSSFVKTHVCNRTLKKILTASENKIRVSFLPIVMYLVMNTCTDFKQKIA